MLMPSIFNESLFDDFFGDFAHPAKNAARYNTSAANMMRTDIKEGEQGFELDVELPGFNKENLDVHLKDGYLTINAQIDENNDKKDEDGKYIRKERYYSSCSRSFYVGKEITEEDIKAKFENGILKLFVPKKEKAAVEEKKYISIEG